MKEKLTKKVTKNLSIRATPEVQEWLAETFQTPSGGAGYVVETFRHLYNDGLRGLKGKFTENELKLMLDVMNGCWLTPGLRAHTLANVYDCGPDGTPDKWGVNQTELIKKMETLTDIQHVCLDIWCRGFWDSDFYKNNPLEKYVEQLK